MPSDDTRCPECGLPLQPKRVGGSGGGSPAMYAVIGAIVLVCVVGGGFVFLQHKAPPAVAVVAAPAAVVAVQAAAPVTPAPAPAPAPVPAPAPAPVAAVPATCAQDPSDLLRLSGSNTIGAVLAPQLVEAWLTSKGATNVHETTGPNPPETVIGATLNGDEVTVDVCAHGSSTAFTDLENNQADIGMASRMIKPAEVAELAPLGVGRTDASEHVIGLDGVAVVVPKTNQIAQLSISQLQQLFSGQITDWDQLGGADQPVHIYARDNNSGTYDTFKTLVLNGTALTPSATRFDDSAQLEAAVAADPGGIGFIGMPYVRSTRAIALYDGQTTPYVPTVYTVKTEAYLLSRRLYLYTPATPANHYVNDFYSWVTQRGGPAQDIVRQAGFVDLNLVEADSAAAAPPSPPPNCTLSSQFPGDPDQYCDLYENGGIRLPTTIEFFTGSSQLDSKATDDLSALA